jgi:hypothetical protein
MALLVCGLIQRDELTSLWRPDQRTNVGKLIARMEARAGLLRDGTNLHDLEEDLCGLFRSRLRTERCEESGVTARAFVLGHLQQGHPVIMGHYGLSFDHWSTVIGYEADDAGRPICLLLLDPSGPEPAVAVWNAVLDIQGSGGIYPYRSWGYGEPTRVAIAHALAIWTED